MNLSQQLVDVAELILLVILTFMQIGRWSQKTEDAPQQVARDAKEALEKAANTHHKLNNHLNSHTFEADQRYATRDTCSVRHDSLAREIEHLTKRVDNLEERMLEE